ncbi:MAG TPA: endonuclease/exonuclease/phosphatase family protein [Devosiaceae bacterium]|nr:endonuclease/exonuclease/phosphatase family protein [Devosiaceae bacterium]
MIRVASYNIQKSIGTDFRRRPGRILDVLIELDADVIALQEVDRRFGERATSLPVEEIAAYTGYDLVMFGARPRSIGWHGNTLLVRRGVEVLTQRSLVLPRLEPRGGVQADLRIGGVAIRVVGLHLGLLGLWRKRQADAVLDQLEALEMPLPTVIMGDLNEWSINGGVLARFARDHHVGEPGPSYPSMRPLFGFDRIIASPEIEIATAGVHNTAKARVASDHLPVWANLKMNGSAVML